MELVHSADRSIITGRIVLVTKLIDEVLELDDRWLLEPQLEQMKRLTFDISNRFQHQQRAPLERLNNCLEWMEYEVRWAIFLIRRPQWPQQCFDYLLRKPKHSGIFLEWNTDKMNKLFRELQTEAKELKVLLEEREIKHGEVELVISVHSRKILMIGLLPKLIDEAVQLDDRRLLEALLQEMKRLTLEIGYPSRHHQRARLVILKKFLEHKVRQARLLTHRPQWPQQCFDCLLCKPRLSGEISEWNANVNKLFKELREIQTDLVEFQTHLVETGIKHGEVVIEQLLREDSAVRIIGVYSGAGIGKTRLLQNVYNTHKVSDLFDVVIWVTVARSGIPEVQDCIAWTLNLGLAVHHSNYEMGKQVKLSEYLKTKKFLLIFDNMLSPLDLNELGVEFGDDKESKLICSSRMKDVIERMRAKNILYIQPLTREEAWELFRSVAFKDGHLPEGLEHIARQVAEECKGSPIAINVIAATMRGNSSVNEWNLALGQMRTPIDHRFPSFELEFDKHLYRILRWSYERLPDGNIKGCFMYCVMFPRDEEIDVDKLVGMWIAEGLVKSMDPTNLIDTAHTYLKLLVDRCLFQVTHIPHGRVLLKAHNTILDVAIYIGRRDEHCLLLQDFSNFPVEIKGNDWKRLSFYGSNIKYLPANGLKCTKLVSLFLGANEELDFVPMSFLDCLPSIRVLDLSRTKLKSLPITLWQLTQLQYLDLSYTQIEYLSEYIGCLSKLQFLNLSGCSQLNHCLKPLFIFLDYNP